LHDSFIHVVDYQKIGNVSESHISWNKYISNEKNLQIHSFPLSTS